ncbi:hypothetical protein [Mesorhizobium sp. J428]|nr:hypothetical protein [Mesorhizobium sp. J428]
MPLRGQQSGFGQIVSGLVNGALGLKEDVPAEMAEPSAYRRT